MAKDTSVRKSGAVKSDEVIDNALRDPSIPHLYVNAVAFVGTSSDICMVVVQNGIATGTINMSFTVAKSIGVTIGQIITRLESATGQMIMTMDHVGDKMTGDEEQ